MSMVERVLITGARAAAALDLAREFHRAGYEVHMADCTTARLSRWSRIPSRMHRYASPVADQAGFRTDISRIVQDIDPLLVVPACEEVFHLAMPALAADLGERLFAPPMETLRTLHDKAAFAQSCAGLGLPVPDTRLLTARSSTGDFSDSERWVFKSCFSRFGGGTRVGPDQKLLASIRPTAHAPWIAQRRIFGEEVSFYAVARGGTLSAFCAYRAKWRLTGGASISFDPAAPELAGVLAKLAARIADAFSITGQFACDLMVDKHGQPWLIECNPRATSGVHLLAGSGELARAICGRSPAMTAPGSGSSHLLPAMLTFGLVQAVRQRRLGEWRAQVRRGSDVAGAAGDRLPAAGAVVDGLLFMLKGVMRGIGTTAATTADIEWNGKISCD